MSFCGAGRRGGVFPDLGLRSDGAGLCAGVDDMLVAGVGGVIEHDGGLQEYGAGFGADAAVQQHGQFVGRNGFLPAGVSIENVVVGGAGLVLFDEGFDFGAPPPHAGLLRAGLVAAGGRFVCCRLRRRLDEKGCGVGGFAVGEQFRFAEPSAAHCDVGQVFELVSGKGGEVADAVYGVEQFLDGRDGPELGLVKDFQFPVVALPVGGSAVGDVHGVMRGALPDIGFDVAGLRGGQVKDGDLCPVRLLGRVGGTGHAGLGTRRGWGHRVRFLGCRKCLLQRGLSGAGIGYRRRSGVSLLW